MGDEHVPERVQRDARAHELARDAVSAVDDVGYVLRNDDLRGRGAGLARPRATARGLARLGLPRRMSLVFSFLPLSSAGSQTVPAAAAAMARKARRSMIFTSPRALSYVSTLSSICIGEVRTERPGVTFQVTDVVFA